VRYVLVPNNSPDTRGWINHVGFRHYRPLSILDPDTPAVMRTFTLPETTDPTRELRLLVGLGEAADVGQGETVAEAVVTLASGSVRTFPIRAGLEAGDTDYERPGVNARHNRVAPAWRWGERDDNQALFNRVLYYVHFPLEPGNAATTVQRVEFRGTRSGSSLIVYGASLFDPPSNTIVSLTEYHLTRYHLAYSGRNVKLFSSDTAQPRAYLVGQGVYYTAPRRALEKLSKPSFNVTQRITLEGPTPPEAAPLIVPGPTDRRTPLPTPPDASQLGRVDIIEDSDTQVTLAAETTQPSFLVLADAYYPHWEATVDGEPTPIMLANYMFRAVYLTPGSHRIEFSYNPRGLRRGALISAATLLVLVAGIFLLQRSPATR
jgi:hypothetical protein